MTTARVLAGESPWSVEQADCTAWLDGLPAACVQCCVTSPPYFNLRDYKAEGQIGLEKEPADYVAKLVEVFQGVKRALRDDGTLWLNLGDSYSASGKSGGHSGNKNKHSADGGMSRLPRCYTSKPKDLLGIPWRVALALQADGWYLRSDVIWEKPNAMVSSCEDRPSKSHEYLFLLTKQPRYFYDFFAVRQPGTGRTSSGNKARKKSSQPNGRSNSGNGVPWHSPDGGRNLRTVWHIPTVSGNGAHFAVFPPALVRPCLLAGTSEKGCCPQCGTPWRRIVLKERVATRPGKDTKLLGHSQAEYGNRDPLRHITIFKHAGWKAGCDCGLPAEASVTCVVMDPFCGSGTTGAVAVQSGLRFLGCDLAAGNCAMSKRRLEGVTPSLFTE